MYELKSVDLGIFCQYFLNCNRSDAPCFGLLLKQLVRLFDLDHELALNLPQPENYLPDCLFCLIDARVLELDLARCAEHCFRNDFL